MSLGEMEQEARSLDSASRRRLMALLIALEDEADVAYRQELAAKIDDKNPDNWISLEEAKRRLLADQ